MAVPSPYTKNHWEGLGDLSFLLWLAAFGIQIS